MGCISTFYDDPVSKSDKKLSTPQEIAARHYFAPIGGCIGRFTAHKVTDEEYDALVREKANKYNSMQHALDKLGIDESMVKEVKPLYLEGFCFGDDISENRGKDMVWRSSEYEVTWIFCGDSQIYFWSCRFKMFKDTKKEVVEEYFYKDITNINSSSESAEGYYWKGNCLKGQNVRADRVTSTFCLSAMGDKRYCAMQTNDEVERAIQGLKAKLREKKNS